MLRLLLIGPTPPPVGGATVSFQQAVIELSRRPGVSVRVVSTTKSRAPAGKAIGTLWPLLRYARASDVIVYFASIRGMCVIGSAVAVIARWLGKRFIVRQFGGWNTIGSPGLRGAIVRFVASNAHAYLVQSASAVVSARRRGVERVYWTPNSRRMRAIPESIERTRCSRFVFVGQVCEEKGVFVLLQAARGLGAHGIVVDLYGPLVRGMRVEDLRGVPGVRYCGVLEPDAVVDVLRQYDALVFPSFYAGEGQPGAILDAYSAGIPVVYARGNEIESIVDQRTGIGVPPRDANALGAAMVQMASRPELYADLCRGVMARRGEFDITNWMTALVLVCRGKRPGHESPVIRDSGDCDVEVNKEGPPHDQDG